MTVAAGGPPPKRAAQRRRRNAPAVKIRSAPGGEVRIPPVARAWHPIAKKWFESLAISGQSIYYETSDWMTAYAVAESMSREYSKDGPISAAAMAVWLRAMGSLMVMEADRRRAYVELSRPGPEDESGTDVSELAEYRRRLSAS